MRKSNRGNPYHDEKGRFTTATKAKGDSYNNHPRKAKIAQYEQELINAEKRNLNPAFRDECKTIQDALPREFERDFSLVKKHADDKEKLSQLRERFLSKANEYSQSWYDEDLDLYRSGYEWEADFYRKLVELCE